METITSLASQLPGADRATVGMPGMIRHGVVIATPHYITKDGPRSKVLPELVEAWARFDMGAGVSRALGIPSLVLNDAEVRSRSEERRVGKECRSRWSPYH